MRTQDYATMCLVELNNEISTTSHKFNTSRSQLKLYVHFTKIIFEKKNVLVPVNVSYYNLLIDLIHHTYF